MTILFIYRHLFTIHKNIIINFTIMLQNIMQWKIYIKISVIYA